MAEAAAKRKTLLEEFMAGCRPAVKKAFTSALKISCPLWCWLTL